MRTAAALVVASIALAAAPSRAAGPLPALPGSTPSNVAPKDGAPAAKDAAAADPGNAVPPGLEKVRRGVVWVEQGGRLVGFGTVLGGDGRVLTALSALAAGDAADVRFADGVVVHAKVGHKDPTWDLALLVPEKMHWKEGLPASESDPAQSDLRAPITPRAGARPIALPVHYKGKTDALSRAGESLLDALDVEVHHSLPLAGAPVLDNAGGVVAVLVRACKLAAATGADMRNGPIACAPTIIGAPIGAVRGFLAKTPASAAAPTAWLGIAGEPDPSGAARGVRVLAIAPESPAQKAGLRAAASSPPEGPDRIVAVDGVPVDSPEKLAEAIAKHVPGDTVKLLLLGGEAFREVAVQLRAAP